MHLLIIESKSTINHNQKLLQALDDVLKWVSKYINNYIFKCSLMLIVLTFIFSHFADAFIQSDLQLGNT